MEIRDICETRIINAAMPYVSDMIQFKQELFMILSDYEFSERTTELAVSDQELTERTIREFIAVKAAAGRSKRTCQFYQKSLTLIFSRMQNDPFHITKDDIRKYMIMRAYQDHVSNVTVNNEYRALSSMLTWMLNEGMIQKNPIVSVEKMKEPKVQKKAFTELEIEKLRLACRTNRERAMIELLLSTWCRLGEIVPLVIRDINDDQVIVHGKGDKYRTVYLNVKSKMALEQYLAERTDNNPYVFPRAKFAGEIEKIRNSKNKRSELCGWYKNPGQVDKNRPMDKGTFEEIIRNIGKRAGVPNTHPHRFRRTGATMALSHGMSLITVSKLLGHESVETTQIYLDVTELDLEAEHKKFVI